MNSRYLTCEGRELRFTEWGAQHRDTVIAWHGLARTGRDMDDIAWTSAAAKEGTGSALRWAARSACTRRPEP